MDDEFPNFSICGIPYYISGDVHDWRNLAHRSVSDLESAGLQLRLNTRAGAIDADRRTVTVTGPAGRDETLPYDDLIIATGAVPISPPIVGLDRLGPADGVHVLRTMGDTLALAADLARSPASALIVGAGYVGLEMAEAFRARGLSVTVVEQFPQVLSTVESQLAELVQAELVAHGVQVVTDTTVHEVTRGPDGLTVSGKHTGGATVTTTADIMLVVVGVRPDTALAATADLQLGARNAIWVDRAMRTSREHIYAAGDCAQTYHRFLDRDVYLPLGSTAHKQGRVAGENVAGGHRVFAGTLGTQVVKVFDLVVTRTGLRDHDARTHGYDPVSHAHIADDHKAYYPDATPIHSVVTGDARTGQLLGAQLVGHRSSAVAKRIDIYAVALHHGMAVDAIADLDLSYTPPLGSPFDAVQTAAQAWTLHQDKEPEART